MTAACGRYPCDEAYVAGEHSSRRRGPLHLCDVGGSSEQGWRVALAAEGDGPWHVAIRFADNQPWTLILDDGRYSERVRVAQNELENVLQLAAAIGTAAGQLAGTVYADGAPE